MNNENYINDSIKKLEIYSDSLIKLVTLPLSLEEDSSLIDLTNSKDNNFNYCQLWYFIKCILVGCDDFPSTLSIDNSLLFENGLIGELAEFLDDLLDSPWIKNCKIKHEIDRFLCDLDCVISLFDFIGCNPNCKCLIGNLFCELIKVIIKIADILVKLIALLIFCNHNNSCRSTDKNTSYCFCDCLIEDFRDELNNLENLLDNIEDIAIYFIKCSTSNCKHNKSDNCSYK